MSHKVGAIAEKEGKIMEFATLIVAICFTIVFAVSHKSETPVIKDVEIAQVVEIEAAVQTVQPKTQVKTDRVIIPVADDRQDLDVNEETSDINLDDLFGQNEDKELVIPDFVDEKEELEAVDFYAVAEKPVAIGYEAKGLNGIAEAAYKNLTYPKMAKAANVAGDCRIKFVISKDGKAINIIILKEKPEGMGFGQAAIDALKQVKFKPGFQQDKPVNVTLILPVKFKLK